MVKITKVHEDQIKEILNSVKEENWKEWLVYHKAQIEIVQEERLAHLLVTLSFSLLFFGSLGLAIGFKEPIFLLLLLVIGGFLLLYLRYLHQLEYQLRRWYAYYQDLWKRSSKQE